MDIKVSFFTHRGRRQSNQDYVMAQLCPPHSPLRCLAVVSDGMGGANGGETASRIAVEIFSDIINYSGKNNQSHPDLIKKFCLKAHKKIIDVMKLNPELKGMGTTLVALVVFSDGETYVANIGDSRAYFVSKNKGAVQVTKDHKALTKTQLEQMLNETGDNTGVKRLSKALNNCLGSSGGEAPKVDIFHLGLSEDLQGGAVLLCSDGLLDNGRDPIGVDDLIIAEMIEDNVFGTSEGQECCHNLTAIAYKEGSEDNITVCLAEFGRLQREDRRIGIFSLPPDKGPLRSKSTDRFNLGSHSMKKKVLIGPRTIAVLVSITLLLLLGLTFLYLGKTGHKEQTLKTVPSIENGQNLSNDTEETNHHDVKDVQTLNEKRKANIRFIICSNKEDVKHIDIEGYVKPPLNMLDDCCYLFELPLDVKIKGKKDYYEVTLIRENWQQVTGQIPLGSSRVQINFLDD